MFVQCACKKSERTHSEKCSIVFHYYFHCPSPFEGFFLNNLRRKECAHKDYCRRDKIALL